jgi:MoaA/NifB/PqqE/SkfB family radical SAM enzyme
MLLGFAITRHCNLRCPHCIRDDVASFGELEPELIGRVVDEARALWGDVTASMTGGEPLIHRRFQHIVRGFAERGVPYNFVSNGWHILREAPLFSECPPNYVRLSLSGGSEAVHDAERGRGSFRRVLLATAVLTRLAVPTAWSIVIDRRDVHELRAVADLAESLGCLRLHYILPQPVPGSMARDSDLDPAELMPVAREVRKLAAESRRRTFIQLDYGAPMEPGQETRCSTFALERVYVDVEGRLSTCCQLSEYGNNNRDVVANLHDVSLADAWPRYIQRLEAQERASAPAMNGADPLRDLPCMRCARAAGKTEWLAAYAGSPWSAAAGNTRRLPVLSAG